MSILIDSSVWINYFRGSGDTEILDNLIDEGLVVINSLILAELVPHLKIRKQNKVISLLNHIERLPINIDWEELIDLQYLCIKKGINKVGIPDLMIAQNAIQNRLKLYSNDKHFKLISEYTKLYLFE
ncbi:MAG: PIN domain-containing protein [Candidatus Marinimicrobia bacterium]|nr:PIN domain-containing protein [Candidatus Neomarinimicrobiota bacterium]